MSYVFIGLAFRESDAYDAVCKSCAMSSGSSEQKANPGSSGTNTLQAPLSTRDRGSVEPQKMEVSTLHHWVCRPLSAGAMGRFCGERGVPHHIRFTSFGTRFRSPNLRGSRQQALQTTFSRSVCSLFVVTLRLRQYGSLQFDDHVHC